ncbi:MAG: hypothetical protein ACYSR9_08760, partial [Planctomycetota bacterium]
DLTASELGPFDVPKPGMYQNIGPLKDLWGSQWSGFKDTSGQITALVRVIKTAKTAEPDSIDQTFSTKSLIFETDTKDDTEDVYSVREKVTEDLKKLAAMETAKNKAEEFISLAAADGWDSTIEKFNELYGKQDADDPNASENVTEPFKLQNLAGMRRVSKAALQTMLAQSAGNPTAPLFLSGRRKQQRFVEKLYSLVPQDSNSVDTVPLLMEFKPDMSFYCIKNLSVQRISLQEYEKIKAMRLQAESYVQSESMVAVHFNPENILKRTNFKPAKTEESEEANTPEESEAAS